MVAAHQQLGGCSGFVQLHAPAQAVIQHITGNTVLMNTAAQHQNAIHILKLRRFLHGQNVFIHRAFHHGVDPKQRADTHNSKAKQDTADPQQGLQPFFHGFLLFLTHSIFLKIRASSFGLR